MRKSLDFFEEIKPKELLYLTYDKAIKKLKVLPDEIDEFNAFLFDRLECNTCDKCGIILKSDWLQWIDGLENSEVKELKLSPIKLQIAVGRGDCAYCDDCLKTLGVDSK